LSYESAENGTLALAEAFAANFVGTDLTEDAREALKFVPPGFDSRSVHSRSLR
jgi:hypothetical protein